VVTLTGGAGNEDSTVELDGTSTMQRLLGSFSARASNGSLSLNGITFTTSGSGDWVTGLAASNGVTIYRDDGDGEFDAASDSLIFSGSGATPTLNATFNAPEAVANNGAITLFMVLNLLSTAGGSTPKTFKAE